MAKQEEILQMPYNNVMLKLWVLSEEADFRDNLSKVINRKRKNKK